MAELVTSQQQVITNVRLFNEHLPELAEFLPYYRAWYVSHDEAGQPYFGPSKAIGYADFNDYLNSAYDMEQHGRVTTQGAVLDGRVTERVLSNFSHPVMEGDPQYETLWAELTRLCSRYGKRPNSVARISSISRLEQAAPAVTDDLVRLLAAVIRGLTPGQQAALREQLSRSRQ